jgi:hypothetical protein
MPRNRTLLIATLLVALCAQAGAQTPAVKTPSRTDKTSSARPSRSEADADPLFAQRRSVAVSLLKTLADEAQAFRDGTVRARAQALAADALWETDAELARTLFRRAWEAADAADREAQRQQEEERKAQLAAHGSAMLSSPPELRAEVLKLAARRDRALGEEFLAALAKAEAQEAETANTNPAVTRRRTASRTRESTAR